jgi:DegV family protein with EDD domain
MPVAIVTDSGSDLTPELLRENKIAQVALSVSIGSRSYLSPDELPPQEFWRLMSAPGAGFARTAAPSAGQFKMAFDRAFDQGADSIVCVCLSESLSSTIQSARLAREMLPEHEIYVVDSRTACMGTGTLALRGAEMAEQAATGPEIERELLLLRDSVTLFVALETLEFLRRGGRINVAEAAIGGLLSVKPIITVVDGLVVTADKPRTRSRARARVIDLLSQRPLSEVHICYSPPAAPVEFRDELLAHLPGPAPRLVTEHIIGPVIGAHVGPGVVGAVVVFAPDLRRA